MTFRELSHTWRGAIWLTAIFLILTTYFSGSIEARGGHLSGYIIFMGFMSVLFFIWAVWSSVPPKN